MVEHVNKDVVLLGSVGKLVESNDTACGVLKASVQDESLVGEFLSIVKVEMIFVGIDLGDLGHALNAGPGLDLGGEGAGLELEFLNGTVDDSKVSLGLDEGRVLRDDGHLEVTTHIVLLGELEEGGRVQTTYLIHN